MEEVRQTLERHETLIRKNSDDIESLKISDAKQDITQQNFQKSMDALTSALHENTQQICAMNEKMGAKQSDNWKFVVSIVLIPVIMFLLNLLAKK